MLQKLFGSQARVKILKLFLLNPDKNYYIRQLARDLKLQVNSVRRELENLEKFGILVSRAGKNEDEEEEEPKKKKMDSAVRAGQEKKFYQADTNFVLYEEIKALIVKAQILYEKEFVDNLNEIGKPSLFVLSGFFVNTDSPVDILVAGRINKKKFIKLIEDLEKELGRGLNYTLFDNNELKYRREITDVFLYGILEGKNIIVVDEFGAS